MNVIESLKNFFKRFRKGESEEQKLLTSGQTTSEKNWREELVKNSQINQPLNFERDDGSTLSLIPRMLQNGKQECETIINEKTGNMVKIPVYTVINENHQQGAQILAHRILLDINIEQLKSFQQDEIQFFANDLLSKERIERVVNQYEKYAGGMYRNQNTRNAYKVKNRWYCRNFET